MVKTVVEDHWYYLFMGSRITTEMEVEVVDIVATAVFVTEKEVAVINF